MEVGIILVEPEIAGNIGATARVMANFGFENLILLNPKANYLSKEAKKRARKAKSILEEALILESWRDLKQRFDTLIGTTGKRASKYNLRRVAISAKELSGLLKGKKGRIGLVFGRERTGLTNEEIDKCDFLVSIKTSEEYPVMNLSHSVAVILHEIYNLESKKELYKSASREAKEAILNQAKKVLKAVEVDREAPILSVLKKLVSRSMIKEREAFTLAGLFREILNKIKKG